MHYFRKHGLFTDSFPPFRAFACWEEKIPVDITAEQQHIATQNEYKKKLLINDGVLPDPSTIKQTEWLGEKDGGLQQWPPIYYHDISNFLIGINTPNDLLHRLHCEYKEGKGFRYFACDFVKEIFWHHISDESPLCFIKCKVTPSQRTSSTAYNVWAAVRKNNPGGKIHSAYCTCTAGLLGSCNHVTGMLFRVEAAVSSGITKPTCTSKLSVWNVPAPTKTLLTIKPMRELIFSKSHYKKRKTVSEARENQEALQAFCPYYKKLDKEEQMREKLYNVFKHSAPQSRFVELMEYKKNRISVNTVSANLPNTVIKEAQNFTYDNNKTMEINVQQFTTNLKLTEKQIVDVYEKTKQQSNSDDWFEQRRGRITASKFHQVFTRVNTLNRSLNESAEKLIQNLLLRKGFETLAIKHGIAMEVHAKETVQRVVRKTHTNALFKDPGMTIDGKFPFLSASPDLEVYCKCCGKFVIEIKCPYSICHLKPSAETLSYLKVVVETGAGEMTKLKKNHSYYTQIQGQLTITKLSFALFFVYTHHGFHIEKISFDPTFWEMIQNNLTLFWFKYLAPAIIGTKESTIDTPKTPLFTPETSSTITTCSSNKTNRILFETPITTKNFVTPSLKGRRLDTKLAESTKKSKRKCNTPTIKLYLCRLCKNDCIDEPKTFEENSICCSKCKGWLHFNCVGIKNKNEVPSKHTRWRCSNCQ